MPNYAFVYVVPIDASAEQFMLQYFQYCILQTRQFLFKWSRQSVQIEWSGLGLVRCKYTNSTVNSAINLHCPHKNTNVDADAHCKQTQS